jgi:hypothetical protein
VEENIFEMRKSVYIEKRMIVQSKPDMKGDFYAVYMYGFIGIRH